GRDPHALFDTSFYLERNPDVAAAGIDPLVHYWQTGAAEGRDPHPLFDTSFYLERNPDVAASGINPLLHYWLAGAAEGRDPHPLFDTSFYLERNPDAAGAGVNPLAHYCLAGAAEGRDPHALFDTSFYLKHNPDVAATGVNPLAHYWQYGAAEGRDPHPLFHAPYYVAENPDCVASGLVPVCHYLVHGRAPQARKVHPRRFDAAFYLRCNPDMPPDETPLEHFITRYESPAPGGLSAEQLREWVERINRGGPGASTGMNETPEVSIIIPDFNGIAYTLGCLQSLLAQQTRYRFEVIVVDDCSTDATPRLLPSIGSIRYVRNPSNSGFIRTCNHGAAQARGKYLLFLNNDVQVIGLWLDELIGTFEQVPQAGLVGSKLIYPTGVLQEAGAIIWNDGSGWNYGRDQDRDQPEYNYLREVDYCSGASIAIPRALWEQLGGFDEHYLPAYAEDCDLAFRVREAGYKVLYQPLSEVVHYEGVTHGRDVTAGVKAYQVVNVRKLYERWQRRMRGHGQPGVDVERERDRRAVGRVLFIDHITPTPDQDSGSLTALGMIEPLLELGYKVTFIPDNLAYVPRYTADLQRLGVECRHQPHDPSIAEHLRRHGALYDAVIVLRGPVAAKHLDAIAELAPQARVIFHTTDLHYLREQRQAEIEQSAARARQAERTKKQELSCIQRSDCTVVVSQFEKDMLAAELPRANVYFFPYMLDVKGCAAPFGQRHGLMFLGGFNHPPNVDAVLHFLDEIFPLVRAQLPGVTFHVVGSNPPPAVRERACADVVVTGLVPDLGDYLDRVRLSVVPLRYGAGIKGKVVMTLSYGVPCVATSIAVEGMGLRDGEEVLIADNPGAVAQAVVRLYHDAELWEALSRRGLEFVEAHYSRRQGQQHVRQILASVGLDPRTQAESRLRLVAA
ncbi:MAG: glycosyltransferase, partial [Gemmataceae bacterium]|nr:glycosyltransferase [Gemmataceae bacterium]